MVEPSILIEHIRSIKLNAEGIHSKMMRTPVALQHYYEVDGKGTLPPLVMLHGIGATATSFDSMYHILKKHYKRIIAPEAVGHGYSHDSKEKPTQELIFQSIASVLNEKIKEPAIVFGNSMGGAIAIEYARKYPEHVKALLLCSPGGAYMEQEDWQRFLKRFKVKNFVDGYNFMNSLLTKPHPISMLFSGYILKRLGSPFIQSLLEDAHNNLLFTPEKLSELKMPIYLIWGKQEKLLLEEHRDFFKAHLPKGTVIDEVEHFSHCPFIEYPKDLAEKIVLFSKKVCS